MDHFRGISTGAIQSLRLVGYDNATQILRLVPAERRREHAGYRLLCFSHSLGPTCGLPARLAEHDSPYPHFLTPLPVNP